LSRTYHAREFARLAGVTVRALHHYDRLGLLQPSGRSDAGYRLYTDRDLVRLEEIVALKFIGFTLNQIQELLNRKNIDLAATLRQQREILAEKRHGLDRTLQAIEQAEQIVACGEAADAALRKIIEVIQVQNKKDWMQKYYTQEQLDGLRKRWSPEVQEQSQRDWAELAQDVEAAIARGEEPSGEAGRLIAQRRQNLIGQFTGGDPGVAANLQKLYTDEANWPSNFKRPFSDAVNRFLCEATKAFST